MKKQMIVVSLAAAVLMSGTVALAGTLTAGGPVKISTAKITALAYYSSGAYHGAMDIGGTGACHHRDETGAVYHRGMMVQTRYYQYFGGCGWACSYYNPSCNSGNGNYIKAWGSNGWAFGQQHMNHIDALGKSRTCYRCGFGIVGSTGNAHGVHVHADNRKNGTKNTYWFTRLNKKVGNYGSYGYTMGYPYMS